MSEIGIAIIARMVARTEAMRPKIEPLEVGAQPGAVIVVQQWAAPTAIGRPPGRTAMRPKVSWCDRKCDLRGGFIRFYLTYALVDDWPVLVARRKVRGRRGGKRPRYKTEHTKRRIGA